MTRKENNMGDSSVKGSQEKIAQIIICTILTVLALLAVLPFVLLVASSLSDEAALLQQGYGFWPRKFSLFAYEYLFLTNYVVIFPGLRDHHIQYGCRDFALKSADRADACLSIIPPRLPSCSDCHLFGFFHDAL